MSVWTVPARMARLGVGLKAGAVVLTLIVGLALTLANAEASGDEYGDSATSTGGIWGELPHATDGVEGTFIQIGTGDGGGSVTVEFLDNVAYNGSGADLRIHTVDIEFPATATIEVSADGLTFVTLGDRSDIADIDIDLGALGLPFATAIRITHVSGETPGFDLDDVEALNQVDLEDLVFTLDPAFAENPGFTEHTITANVDDGEPAFGVLVSFAILTGPNDDESGVAPTDLLGDVPFAWIGDDGPGLDLIEAWLDIDGSGTRNGDEPFAIATKQWHGVTGTIELIDLDGGGLVVGDIVHVIVDDRDLDTTDDPDTVVVTVTSTSHGAGIEVTLTETGSHTGIFSGLVELGETSDEGTGVLAAVAGDDITGIYDDELDGEGNGPEQVTASITVGDSEESGTKVTVCHRPPGNPGNQKTLTVGSSALDAHLGHGDAVGKCGESEILTKQEEAQARNAERDEQRAAERSGRELQQDERADQRETDRNDAFCERKNGDHPRCQD